MLTFIKKHWKSTVVVIVIFICSFINPPEIQEIPGFSIGWDKIIHVIMFFTLSIALMLEFFVNYSTKLKLKFWLICAFSPIFLGGLVEILQGTLTTTRSCDFDDLLADILGVLLALVCIKIVKNLINKNLWFTKI
ncbi:MAG: VanZ family protein [Paludibacter sp.]|jgi:VanZ family protein|nr:VanZ family protein [Paludibacter sp.]